MNDVGLIIEGSYPYVTGGVASWTQQLIQNFPELSFELFVLLAQEDKNLKPKYKVPQNVTRITNIYLQKGIKKPLFMPKKTEDPEILTDFLFRKFELHDVKKATLKPHKACARKRTEQFLYSEQTFDLFESHFQEQNLNHMSFLHFFWQLRSLSLGILNIMLADLPPCRLFHPLSTGYAGLLASKLKILYPDAWLLLTEHGIYNRERQIELSMTSWPNQKLDEYRPDRAAGFYNNLWTRTFQSMGLSCYQASDSIVSLFGRNNEIQIINGADPAKVSAIHNGINVDLFQFQKKPRCNNPPVIGFLGRVVKIKDVKTFIRACSIVIREIPEARVMITGPTDEDEEYFEDCQRLVELLNLGSKIKFTGKMAAATFFTQIDILVLTSLSEGQPLVILEGYSCGIPAVATDVGACREIIAGGGEDVLGPAGVVTKAANPSETAKGIIKLIKSPDFFRTCAENGYQRAKTWYSEQDFIDRYRKEYYKGLKRN